jgi:hypothetical protein
MSRTRCIGGRTTERFLAILDSATFSRAFLVFFLVWLLAKEDIGRYRPITRV